MKSLALVALGGALGSVLRWAVSAGVQRLLPHSAIPWGTFTVNLVGSFAIGLIMTLALERAFVSDHARLFLVTGILGGFTTFSALSWNTLELVRSGHAIAAGGYALGSVALGLIAAFAGMALAHRI